MLKDSTCLSTLSFPTMLPDDLVKTSVSLNVDKRSPAPSSSIPASLFQGTSIYVNIVDKKRCSIAKTNLKYLGAKISNGIKNSEMVISDNQIKIPPKTRSRGAILQESANKKPNVILTKQIPWIYETTLQKAIQPKAKKPKSIQMIVVADSFKRYAPRFKVLDEKVRIYYPKQKLPLEYTISPFSQIPTNVIGSIEKVNKANALNVHVEGPNDNTFCELCGIPFTDAKEHRESYDHQRHSNMLYWIDVDNIGDLLFEKSKENNVFV